MSKRRKYRKSGGRRGLSRVGGGGGRPRQEKRGTGENVPSRSSFYGLIVRTSASTYGYRRTGDTRTRDAPPGPRRVRPADAKGDRTTDRHTRHRRSRRPRAAPRDTLDTPHRRTPDSNGERNLVSAEPRVPSGDRIMDRSRERRSIRSHDRRAKGSIKRPSRSALSQKPVEFASHPLTESSAISRCALRGGSEAHCSCTLVLHARGRRGL